MLFCFTNRQSETNLKTIWWRNKQQACLIQIAGNCTQHRTNYLLAHQPSFNERIEKALTSSWALGTDLIVFKPRQLYWKIFLSIKGTRPPQLYSQLLTSVFLGIWITMFAPNCLIFSLLHVLSFPKHLQCIHLHCCVLRSPPCSQYLLLTFQCFVSLNRCIKDEVARQRKKVAF